MPEPTAQSEKPQDSPVSTAGEVEAEDEKQIVVDEVFAEQETDEEEGDWVCTLGLKVDVKNDGIWRTGTIAEMIGSSDESDRQVVAVEIEGGRIVQHKATSQSLAPEGSVNLRASNPGENGSIGNVGGGHRRQQPGAKEEQSGGDLGVSLNKSLVDSDWFGAQPTKSKYGGFGSPENLVPGPTGILQQTLAEAAADPHFTMDEEDDIAKAIAASLKDL